MVCQLKASASHGCYYKQFLRGKVIYDSSVYILMPVGQGGSVLGNGTWLNVGGNGAVTYGGNAAQSSGPPYYDPDGGQSYAPVFFFYIMLMNLPCFTSVFGTKLLSGVAITLSYCRMLNPCDDRNCGWVLGAPMTTKRCYPTL
jgi:hypothetical protein